MADYQPELILPPKLSEVTEDRRKSFGEAWWLRLISAEEISMADYQAELILPPKHSEGTEDRRKILRRCSVASVDFGGRNFYS